MTQKPEMETEEVLKVKLAVLKSEHRKLDEELGSVSEGALGNTFLIKRLKKRKLSLKDQIANIQDRLTPDIIA